MISTVNFYYQPIFITIKIRNEFSNWMLKSKFIADILELLLDRDNYGIKTRPQIDFITESDYEYTGNGVFIGFEHTKGIEKYRFEEDDLINLIKQIKYKDFILGTDIGIISYNDTPLKALLDISVLSTDFKKMGEKVSYMILNSEKGEYKVPFNFIDRNSV